MRYPPTHHQEENYDNIIFLMQSYPLATINSCYEERLLSSHTPLIYQRNKGLGRLIGHLDKYNPQLEHFKKNPAVSVIFHGPQVYISPSVYQTTQLPTWNYFKAHIQGKITIEKDQSVVKQSLIDMTTQLEGAEKKYRLEAENPRMLAALDYIVGFSITIDQWEGKYKISQDKRKTDQQRAKQAMIQATHNTGNIIEKLYALHQTKTS